MYNDQWAQHIGKEVTLLKQVPSMGGLIEQTQSFLDSAGKSRHIKGKVVGTNGQGSVLVMLDKPFSHPSGAAHYTNYGNLANVAMEYREEVFKNHGSNKFVWINVNSYPGCMKLGEKIETKTDVATNESQKNQKKESFLDTLKSDAADAAFRIAAKKIADGVRNVIALAMMAKLGGNQYADGVRAVLETPMGLALVQAVAGYTLTYGPKKLTSDPRAKRLAKEFRVSSMETVGGVVVDELMVHLTPLFDQALSMLPGGSSSSDNDQKVRVTEQEQESDSNVIDIDQAREESGESSKRMAAGAAVR